jgi:hypothetical protein
MWLAMADPVTAWAAVVAAGASLATLVTTTVVSGRRERRVWTREALTEAFIQFLDASWRSSDAVDRALSLSGVAKETEVNNARAAYAAMRSHLTRLRLLGSATIASSGNELLSLHGAAIDGTDYERKRLLPGISGGRRTVIDAAKREMSLPV